MKEKIAKLILEETKKNYNLIAPAFSETRQRLWPDFDFFEKYIQEGDDILDIGCGNGRFYEFLKDKKINYRGVDNSANLILEAKKRYPAIASNFEVGDILTLKTYVKFDKIFCLAVLHHLPSQALRLKALGNLKENLKENSLLFLTCWNLFNRKYRPYIIKYGLLKFPPREIMPGIKSTNLDFKDVFIPWKKTQDKKIILRYCHAFTLGELAALVKKAGFKVIAQFYSKAGKISTFLQAHNLILICQPRSNPKKKFTQL